MSADLKDPLQMLTGSLLPVQSMVWLSQFLSPYRLGALKVVPIYLLNKTYH